jgi:hypothetical protein
VEIYPESPPELPAEPRTPKPGSPSRERRSTTGHPAPLGGDRQPTPGQRRHAPAPTPGPARGCPEPDTERLTAADTIASRNTRSCVDHRHHASRETKVLRPGVARRTTARPRGACESSGLRPPHSPEGANRHVPETRAPWASGDARRTMIITSVGQLGRTVIATAPTSREEAFTLGAARPPASRPLPPTATWPCVSFPGPCSPTH